VDVPVRLGLDSASSALDLDVTWWIPVGTNVNASSIDQAITSMTITHWPFDEAQPLQRSYTVFCARQPDATENIGEDSHPINTLVNGFHLGLRTPWTGSVLVVRSDCWEGVACGVDDMSDKDTYSAKAIVRRRGIHLIDH
jgi:hypothetical protein